MIRALGVSALLFVLGSGWANAQDARSSAEQRRTVLRGGKQQTAVRSPVTTDSVTAAGDTAALPVITRRAPSDTISNTPPRSRPRAALMRMRGQNGAPSFCESGAGHPLFGREWCHARGFRLGDDWERARGRDLPLARSATRGVMNVAALRDLFGDELADAIDDTRMTMDLADEFTARWISTPLGGSILVLSVQNRPLAELVDRDRDGFADVVWLARVR